MKSVIKCYILLFLLPFFAFSQKVYVKATYFFEKNVGTGPLVTEAQLYVTPKQSDFVWPDFKRTRPMTAEDFGLPPGTPITIMNQSKQTNQPKRSFRIFLDLPNNKLYETKNDMGTEYIVYEDRTKIQWHVEDEQKKIDSFTVTKAKAKFRGRNYVVWFTTEIPVNAGPWKLNGLPGLILEAEDEANALKIKLLKVEINTPEAKNHVFVVPAEGIKTTLKEYVEREKLLRETLKASTMSKMPRDMQPQFPEFDASRYRLEFDFEWEQNTPKDKKK